MARQLKTLLDGLVFGEGPRWRDGRLIFSDMHAHEVVAMTPNGERETVVRHTGPVSGLGFLPDGRMLIVSMTDRKLLRREPNGTLATHADLSQFTPYQINDMVVDATGRAYIGNFGTDSFDKIQPTRLARVDRDGSVHDAASDLVFPNGMVITPDGKTLVVAETFAGRLTAFSMAADGSLSRRRVWAQLPEGAAPDGICLDAEGAIWVASPRTNDTLRVREGGAVVERVPTGQMSIACMLGGADRRTLFLLTSEGVDPEVCKKKRSAKVQSVTVEIAGAGLP